MVDFNIMWKIKFILPNLRLKEVFQNDFIAIVSHNDKRIIQLKETNPIIHKLIEGFTDQFNRKEYPCFLILNSNAPDFIKNDEAFIGFRNIFAISCIIEAHERFLTNTFAVVPLYSDFFDFYPTKIRKNEREFITYSQAFLGIDKPDSFQGQINPGLPRDSIAEPDKIISRYLLKIWDRRYFKGKLTEWETQTLFRSLEMVYHACAMPSENNSSIYDSGAKMSLWVSAFEILSHPSNEDASLDTVVNILENYSWKDDESKRKQFSIKCGKRIVTLPSKLYEELYKARNDFLHGNPVNINRLYPFKKKNKHTLNRFAPLIYKVALLSYMDIFKDKRRKISTEELASQFSAEWNLVDAIQQSRPKYV